MKNIFAVPVSGKYLVHAPLHRLTALVNHQAARAIRDGLTTGIPAAGPVGALTVELACPVPAPTARHGDLAPLFLGLIPTRGCNMACRYCDFAAPKRGSPVMPLATARAALDAYFQLDIPAPEVHFFGGEPFYAEPVVRFAVEYAALRAAEAGKTVRFEVTTNGLYSAGRCRWTADTFDTVVLSLDGLPDEHDLHRPALNGRGTSGVVIRSARILSEGTAELVLRACVSEQTAPRLPAFARWIGRELRPSTVCLEPLSESPLSRAAGLQPPDPWAFARYFDQAALILAEYGIQTVLSSADLRAPRASFCPVGKDALIVSPDGAVNACYLLDEEWLARGLDMRLGRVNGGAFDLDARAVQRARQMTVDHRPRCANCLCRYYCAGGCHVHHDTQAAPGQYDDLCAQTRLITAAALLRQVGGGGLADDLLADRSLSEAVVYQPDDRLEVLC